MKRALLILFLLTTSRALATEGVPEQTIITSDSVVATVRLTTGWKYIRCLGTNYFRLEATSAAAALEDSSGIKLPAGVLWTAKVTPNTRWIGIRSDNGTSGCYVYATDNPNPTPLASTTGADIAPDDINAAGTVTADHFVATTDGLDAQGDVVIGLTQNNNVTLAGGTTGATITVAGETDASLALVTAGTGVVTTSGSLTVGNDLTVTDDATVTDTATVGTLRIAFTTLGTCSSSIEGALRLNVLSGVSTGAATRLCMCRSNGSAVYTWINVVTGTDGTATTCAA